jgi:hypothetical protein
VARQVTISLYFAGDIALHNIWRVPVNESAPDGGLEGTMNNGG